MSNAIKILLGLFAVFVSLTLLVISIAIFEFLPVDMSIIFVALSVIVFILALIMALMIDYGTGEYECKKCGHKFKPTFGAYIWSIHMPTGRYLKCPHCGKRNFCKRRFSE